ncbi:MAG TPA: S8 family serine peptidase, partial [Dissulfurispiraceae bacterium]|nr:S8 family serine peptidase [Dissulfurispiraceae bacterium]
MKRLFPLLIVMLLFAVGCGEQKSQVSSAPSTPSTKETVSIGKTSLQTILARMDAARYREGEVIVKFRPGSVRASSLGVHREVGARVMKRFALNQHMERVKLPQGLSVREAIELYSANPHVEYAEPNYIRRASATIPNDAFFNQQWPLLNTGRIANGTPGADIKATEAWDITRGSPSVIVAVIDTGIDHTHPDLRDNVWRNPGEPDCANGIDDDGNGRIDDCRGWNFVAETNDPFDDNGHGTHVSGIIGAAGNNGVGVSGMMWHVQIMPLKILSGDGFGSIADEIDAIGYAVSMGARVINASFSGTDFSNAEFDTLRDARNAGVLVVAAAGNGGDDGVGDNNDLFPSYPASYALDNIIAVAATDQNDRKAVFSNFGPNTVHVGEPGVYILSTVPGGYSFESGTSMSAPYVSGVAGLLMSYYTHFSHAQIRSTIFRYVDVLPSLSGLIQTGGRVNAYKTLSSLLAPEGLTATAPSSHQVTLAWTDRATGEDGYRVERRVGSGAFEELKRLPPDTTRTDDTTVADGTVYFYRVKAFNAIGESSESLAGETTVTTPLTQPAGLSAAAPSATQVDLLWTDTSRSEQGYAIERRGQSGAFVQIAVTGQNASGFRDTALTPSTAYVYRIRAFNAAAGNSAYSNELAVTTPADGTQSSVSTGGGGGGG